MRCFLPGAPNELTFFNSMSRLSIHGTWPILYLIILFVVLFLDKNNVLRDNNLLQIQREHAMALTSSVCDVANPHHYSSMLTHLVALALPEIN